MEDALIHKTAAVQQNTNLLKAKTCGMISHHSMWSPALSFSPFFAVFEQNIWSVLSLSQGNMPAAKMMFSSDSDVHKAETRRNNIFNKPTGTQKFSQTISAKQKPEHLSFYKVQLRKKSGSILSISLSRILNPHHHLTCHS